MRVQRARFGSPFGQGFGGAGAGGRASVSGLPLLLRLLLIPVVLVIGLLLVLIVAVPAVVLGVVWLIGRTVRRALGGRGGPRASGAGAWTGARPKMARTIVDVDARPAGPATPDSPLDGDGEGRTNVRVRRGE
jgi:hypothetical protein